MFVRAIEYLMLKIAEAEHGLFLMFEFEAVTMLVSGTKSAEIEVSFMECRQGLGLVSWTVLDKVIVEFSMLRMFFISQE